MSLNIANASRQHAARLTSWAGALKMREWKMREQIECEENVGVDKVWKAVRIKYLVDKVWLPRFPRVRTNNLRRADISFREELCVIGTA